MNRLLASIAIGISAAAASDAALADSPGRIDTMTCTRTNGSAFTDDVYAYTLQAGSLPGFLSVYLAGDKFNAWWLDLYDRNNDLAHCELSGLTATILAGLKISNITSAGIGKNVAAGSLTADAAKQRYTVVTLSFTSMGVSPSNLPAPQGAPVTKEAEQKALADFQARGLPIPH